MIRSNIRTSNNLSRSVTEAIDDILSIHDYDSSRLVGILLEIQETISRKYISKEIAVYIGDKLELPLSRVYDVISFYEALSDVPRAEVVVQFCDSVVCKITGNSGLRNQLENLLGISIGETTPDGKYHLESSPCFGACDRSPAIRINGVVYGPLNSEVMVRDAILQYEKGVDIIG